MALITCPECGKEVSDQAKQCPNCGYELKGSFVSGGKKIFLKNKKKIIILAVLLFIFVVALFSYKPINKMIQENKRQKEIAAEIKAHEEAVANDHESPVISNVMTEVQINTYDVFNREAFLEQMEIKDNLDGEIDKSEVKIEGDVNSDEAGEYTISLSVSDEAGNLGVLEVKVNVVDKYSKEQVNLYQAAVEGYHALRATLKSPDSLRVYGVVYHSDNNSIIFNYGASNSFGAEVRDYAAYEIARNHINSAIQDVYYKSSKSTALNWDVIVEFSQSPYNK